MNRLLAIVFVAVSGCCAVSPPGAKLPALRVEHHEWLAQPGGTDYRDDYYRGNQKVLRVVRFQNKITKTWETWRFLYIDGKAVLFEDDKGDGKQSISLIKDNSTYDQFTRQPDGSFAPVSSDELDKIRAKEK
jgi:hypothetical protein